QTPVAPAARASRTTSASSSGRSLSPGRIGAIPTRASTPASTSIESARSRWRGADESLDAGAREAVAALRRLVRIGRRPDRNRLVLPRRPGKLSPQHVGDVRLDADARAVAVVPRPVCPGFEGADVTEGAAVRAAHVRVE